MVDRFCRWPIVPRRICCTCVAIAQAPIAIREPLAAYLDLWPSTPGVLALIGARRDAPAAVMRQLRHVSFYADDGFAGPLLIGGF